jgi:3-oxoacyl-[acyl-carrier protein] reductase
MNIDLGSEQILVTGSSRGIGKAIFDQLKSAGANVLGHNSGNTKSEQENVISADLSEVEETKKLFGEAIRKLPKLNCIILNAGVFLDHSSTATLEDWLEVWHKTISINLTSVGILSKMAIDHFRKIGGGRLIFIGSRAAFRGETHEYLAYAASKGGMTSLAKSIARSFGKENIKAFVIAPGFTQTAMADQFISEYGEQRVIDELALNSLTQPSDIAPLVVLMASGLMDHATGTTVDLNAGSHIR